MQSFYTFYACQALQKSGCVLWLQQRDSVLGLQLCQECQGKVLIVSQPILVLFIPPDG